MDRERILAENRAKALERLKQRQRNINNRDGSSSSVQLPAKAAVSTTQPLVTTNVPKELTPQQKLLVERNRQQALDRAKSKNHNGNSRDATQQVNNVADDKKLESANKRKKLNEWNAPSIKRSDYIEYDFSTMKDTYGGFIAEEANGSGESKEGNKTLEQWQEGKKKYLKDPAPPIDIANAPKCFECQSIEVDPKFLEIFGCRVCRKCKEKFPEKYSLLTKTECREDYLLTDPELKDTDLFKRIIKPNPYSGTYSVMQLFLRYQVEEFAFKKWGSEEGLDEEWKRREEMKMQRKDKKYEAKLKDMRKRLRAEEFTRRLKGEDVDGASSNGRHEHDWSRPYDIPNKPNTVKRRCIDCGLEIEEIMI